VYNAEVSGQRSRSYLLEDARQRTAEAERLDLQARVLFPLERVALAEHGVGAGQTLLDLGCGQGTFLSQMAQAFGGMRCFGLDRNPGLLAEARSRPGIADVALCDVADPPALLQQLERHHPDLIFSRFVLQHMSAGERDSLLRTVARYAARHPLRVVLADVDAASSFFEPPSPLLAEAREALGALQARAGGDRKIGGRLSELLQDAGFSAIRTSRVCATSDAIGFAPWWAAFGSVLCAGLSSRPAAQEALREWAADPATAVSWRAGFEICFASSATASLADG
jgi:SAM-dependent methyltransferase